LREPASLAAGAKTGETGFARQAVTLSGALASELRDRAKARQVTLNALFQAAWVATCAAFTETTDVVHAVLLTGRSTDVAETAQLGGVVGPAFNLLPLRTRLDPAEPVAALLPRLQAALVELGGHETTPLDRVLAWSELPAGALPCDSYLVFQNVGLVAMERSGETCFVSKMGFPLRVDVFPTSVVSLHLSYHREDFADATVTRLLAGFHAALAALAGDPALSTRDLIAAVPAAVAPDGVRTYYEGALRVPDIRGDR
jgi:non-ribosomal peptide synthetase component F